MKKTAFLIAVCLALSSCMRSGPSQFYRIMPVDSTYRPNMTKTLYIVIDMVSIPGYLERPQIVTVKSDVELDMSEFNRWAEPLNDSLQRVIAQDLSKMSSYLRVSPFIVFSHKADYTVMIEINRLEGLLGGKAVLEARFGIKDKNGSVVGGDILNLSQPIGNGYDDLVREESEMIGALSELIAKKLSVLKP